MTRPVGMTKPGLLLCWMMAFAALVVVHADKFDHNPWTSKPSDREERRRLPASDSVLGFFGNVKCRRELHQCLREGNVPGYGRMETYLEGIAAGGDAFTLQVLDLVRKAKAIDFSKIVNEFGQNDGGPTAESSSSDGLLDALTEGTLLTTDIDTSLYPKPESSDGSLEIADFAKASSLLVTGIEKMESDIKPGLEAIVGADSELAAAFDVTLGTQKAVADYQAAWCGKCLFGNDNCQRCLIRVGVGFLFVFVPITFIVLFVSGLTLFLGALALILVTLVTSLVAFPFQLLLLWIIGLVTGNRRSACGAQVMQCEFDNAMSEYLPTLVSAAELNFFAPDGDMSVDEALDAMKSLATP